MFCVADTEAVDVAAWSDAPTNAGKAGTVPAVAVVAARETLTTMSLKKSPN